MDAIVAQAMTRWPNVPAVYGWLRLDRRGRWLVKGEPIGHRPTAEFIGRNYQCDERGRYYFQNGPQRVFVDIDHCPYVLSLASASGDLLVTHTGVPASALQRAWLDADGGLLVEFELGPGSMLDRDLARIAECITGESGERLEPAECSEALAATDPRLRLALAGANLPLRRLPAGEMARQLGFDRAPRPAAGEDACV
jgi:hypothetical protein